MTGRNDTRCEQFLHLLPVQRKVYTIYFRNEVMRSLVVDGNFKADHIKLKRATDDVWLTDGEGMMTARAPYKAHLAIAIETKEVKSYQCSTQHNESPLNI